MTIISNAQDILSLLMNNQIVGGIAITSTYKKLSASTFDSSTMTYSNTTEDISVQAVPLEYSIHEVASSLGSILATDVRFFVIPPTGVSLEGSTDDLLVVENITYKIKNPIKHAIGSTALVYELQCGAINE